MAPLMGYTTTLNCSVNSACSVIAPGVEWWLEWKYRSGQHFFPVPFRFHSYSFHMLSMRRILVRKNIDARLNRI
ncbi:MAG: hypothetical protein F4W68_07790 [Cenarchaeum sp. SB0661_bin_35]|nr:hypothetical protein [Cenarchaeum sp. SB0661_bin_35]